MNRAEFLRSSARAVACTACAATILRPAQLLGADEAPPVTPVDVALKRAQAELDFTGNWLADLFATIEAELDRPTQVKLLEGCGRGCFRRHGFKQDIARAGAGDLDKLLAAYRKNYRVQREGEVVHLYYGDHCYCPAAQHRPPRPNDLQCECTKATHQAIFETALGRKFRADVAESIRRGGKTCHIRIYLT